MESRKSRQNGTGVVVVPMPFLIAGETYFEDVTLTHDAFFARLQEDVDISTSQPSPETVMEISMT